MLAALGSTDQYLTRYAEPEARVASLVPETFRRAVVVPVYGEHASFLDGYRAAARAAPGPTLCIVVVNAPASAPKSVHAANLALGERVLEELDERCQVQDSPPIWLGRWHELWVLLIDRASPAFRLPEKQGVGLARRIGCDVALSLVQSSKITSPWLASSDADVVLPPDYFATLERSDGRAVAVAYPFNHVATGDAAVDRATALYDVWLRYYVLGLAFARSPYAFHTVGSSLAVRADVYAGVRGFPRREAGEDFYLMIKAAKLGPIARPDARPIQIRARTSSRVPFGTGRGVQAILERDASSNELELYDPRSFAVLSATLRCLESFVRGRDYERALDSAGETELSRAALGGVLEELGLPAACAEASRQAPREAQLRRRLHTWFDAFRTLRFVHTLRDRFFPLLAWQAALERAPFCRELTAEHRSEPEHTGRWLFAQEQNLPPQIGPTCGDPPG